MNRKGKNFFSKLKGGRGEVSHSLSSFKSNIYKFSIIFFYYLEAKDVFALLKGDKLKPGEEPTFTWFKSGQEFDPDDRFKVYIFLYFI